MKYHLVIIGADTDVKCICEAHKAIKEYAFILHNEASLTNPHFHLYLNVHDVFNGINVYPEEIAEWFDIPLVYLDRGYPTRIELNYMLHSREMLYDSSAIIANFDIMPYLNGSET